MIWIRPELTPRNTSFPQRWALFISYYNIYHICIWPVDHDKVGLGLGLSALTAFICFTLKLFSKARTVRTRLVDFPSLSHSFCWSLPVWSGGNGQLANPCPDLLAIYQTWLKIVKKEILQIKMWKSGYFFTKRTVAEVRLSLGARRS